MLRVVEAFSGIRSQTQALKNLNIKHDVVATFEIDKWAVEMAELLHGKVNNLGDISEVDSGEVPEHDLFTYTFPCQDISTAGHQAGLEKNSGTRSSLLWECKKIIEHCKPEYLLMENVDNLLSKRHIKQFIDWLVVLEKLGYKNYYKILDAKDFRIPQRRKRVFCISILGNEKFIFPKPIELNLKLRDMLEKEVPEKYYLKDINNNKFHMNMNKKQGYFISGEVANALTSKNNRNNLIQVGYINTNSQGNRAYTDDVACTISALGDGGAKTGLYLVPNEKIIDDDISYCITASYHKGTNLEGYFKKGRRQLVQDDNFRIRRLTPRECWRLMGWKDEQIDKVIHFSDKQLIEKAGNSIVIDVLEEIFRSLFLTIHEEGNEYRLF